MTARYISLCLGLLFGTVALAADTVPTTSGHGSIYFGDYEPKEAHSLSELPISVRDVLRSHLRARLGDLFYRRLRFVGGEIIDKDQLLIQDPDSKDYQWEVPSYVLNFDFQVTELGIPSFPAQIELRADGSVIKEVDLPAFGTQLTKQAWFPFKAALSVAVARGFTRDGVTANLVYVERFDSLAWDFREVSEDNGLVIKSETLLVSAHTGELLDVGVSEAIR